MNSKDITFVFSGFGVEYSLSPLARYMKEHGFKVVELDMSKVENIGESLINLKGQPIVYITSWHLFFDAKNFDFYYSTDKEVFSPLEIMEYLKPIKSYYYPHDIATFLHQDEWEWLDLFDAALLPYKNNDYYFIKKYTKVYEVGWIKKWRDTKRREINKGRIKVLYLPSNIAYHMKRYTIEQYGEMYKELLARCDAVKFPSWPGIERLECLVRENGGTIIENEKTLFDVIEEYDLVVATGASGVVEEAYTAGWPVLSVLDDALSEEEYKKMIPVKKGIYICNLNDSTLFIDNVKIKKQKLACPQGKLEKFRVNQVIDIITNLGDFK